MRRGLQEAQLGMGRSTIARLASGVNLLVSRSEFPTINHKG